MSTLALCPSNVNVDGKTGSFALYFLQFFFYRGIKRLRGLLPFALVPARPHASTRDSTRP